MDRCIPGNLSCIVCMWALLRHTISRSQLPDSLLSWYLYPSLSACKASYEENVSRSPVLEKDTYHCGSFCVFLLVKRSSHSFGLSGWTAGVVIGDFVLCAESGISRKVQPRIICRNSSGLALKAIHSLIHGKKGKWLNLGRPWDVHSPIIWNPAK